MDPLQWMGAVRMRVQTADKNITIIHTVFTSCEMKSCHCFWLKYESFVLVSFDVRGQRDGHFPHWLWIIDSYFVQKQQDKVKTTLMIYLFLKNRQLCTSQDIYCVDHCDVFISSLDSFWRHPFTAEDPLVSKSCNATFLKIYSVEETNSLQK